MCINNENNALDLRNKMIRSKYNKTDEMKKIK